MARSTSGRGLRRLLGSDPGEECIYTAECVAAAATVYLAMLNVGLTAPTAAARSLWLPSLNAFEKERQVLILSFRLNRNGRENPGGTSLVQCGCARVAQGPPSREGRSVAEWTKMLKVWASSQEDCPPHPRACCCKMVGSFVKRLLSLAQISAQSFTVIASVASIDLGSCKFACKLFETGHVSVRSWPACW